MVPKRKLIKKKHILLSLILFFYVSILIIPKYDTFAWFTAESFAEGKITNANTSDLLNIDVSEVQYQKNCKVKTSVTITNISNIEIPVSLDLISKENQSKSKWLQPGEAFSSGTNVTDPSCDASQVMYHLYAFEGYVDEKIVVPLSPEKMIKPVEPKKEDTNDESKKEPEVEKEEPQIPEIEEPPQQDPAPEEEVPTDPTPQPEENPDTTNPDDDQADTPIPAPQPEQSDQEGKKDVKTDA
ncbi:hypothetical protein [Fictibacillus phosphorivorans]|uniref:hypothetical protein n=1 Tax=Fictibacillus phosphorivorans TaxID=1221500 RepID=UPI00119CF47C|nr:hypothetical protein [Fictibacillus phosphorivorans]